MRILVIGDLHIPFVRKGALEFCRSIYKQYKCTNVVVLGDILDQYCFSRYTKDPDAMGAAKEFEKALNILQGWYNEFPDVKLIIGNHDLRVYKRAMEVQIPTWFMQDLRDVIRLPKKWEVARQFEIEGVLYRHGEGLSKNAEQAITRSGMSVVYGHTHQACIAYKANRRERLFGFNAGCLVDEKAYAFEYAKDSINKSMVGCGIVIDGNTAIFEPMPLESKRRKK